MVFTDVVMHGMDGVELTRQIKARFPHVLVVALSCYSDISYVKDIIRLGAEDYLQKLSMRPDEVVSMLKACTAKLNARSSGPQEDRKRKHADALMRMIGSGAREGELKALMGERECPVRFMVLCAKTGEDPAGRLNLAEAALDGRGYVSCRFRENAVAALIPDAPEDRLRAQAREILACGGTAEGQGNDPLCVGWGDAFSREDDLPRQTRPRRPFIWRIIRMCFSSGRETKSSFMRCTASARRSTASLKSMPFPMFGGRFPS